MNTLTARPGAAALARTTVLSSGNVLLTFEQVRAA
jgi:hypothetical protein